MDHWTCVSMSKMYSLNQLSEFFIKRCTKIMFFSFPNNDVGIILKKMYCTYINYKILCWTDEQSSVMNAEKNFSYYATKRWKNVQKQNKKYFCLLDIFSFSLFIYFFYGIPRNNIVYPSFINHMHCTISA